MRSTSLFDAFNARFLEPERVGKSFIFTRQFEEVARHQHTLIIGPRGSGKTTYLKMLTRPALSNWAELRHHRFAQSISYHTIYIPSDFSWYPEFRLPFSAPLSIEVDHLLTTALFRSHVLLAVCDTVQHMARPNDRAMKYFHQLDVKLSRSDWDQVAERLAFSWDVAPPFGGIAGLRLAIERNIQTIQRIMVSSALTPRSAASLMEQWPLLSRFFYDDLRSFADALADATQSNQFYCVCFDEVEIAPVPVRAQIVQSARSFDQRFLVKISSSPFDEADPGQATSVGSMTGHDYHQVMLTQMGSPEVMRFSKRLFTALCQEIGINNVSPEEMLGSSVFAPEMSVAVSQPRVLHNGYAPAGKHWRRFKNLEKKDPSFKEYITRNKIDIDRIDEMPEQRRAALVRKVIAPVVVREAFLSDSSIRSGRIRSRKAIPDLYTGARTIFTLCEGNPRWLIGLLRPLIEHYAAHPTAVPTHVQAHHIERTLQQYLSLISTIKATTHASGVTSAIKLIQQIGEYFRKETLVADFNPDPVGSFILDAMVSQEIEDLVGRALNQGAFVLMPRKNQAVSRGVIRGQRLRLTHLLSPFFQLAIVAGRPIDLSRVISEPTDAVNQIDLFAMMEVKNAE